MADPGVRRRKLTAFILSGIFPGLGQFYNREFVKGILFLGVGAVLTWLMERAVPTDLLAEPPFSTRLLVPFLLLLAVYFWSVVDAWRSPHP